MCGRNRSVCDVSDPRFLCHVHKFINSALITVWHYQTAFQETVRSFLIVCLQLWILNMMILVQTWDIHSLWVIFAVLDSILLWQNFSHSHGGRQLSAVKIECRGTASFLKCVRSPGASWISVEESGQKKIIKYKCNFILFFLVKLIFHWNVKGK